MATHDADGDAFDAALTGGDPDEFVALLAPGAIVWHNHDRKEVDARREHGRASACSDSSSTNLKNERVLLSADRRRLRAAVRDPRHGALERQRLRDAQLPRSCTTTDDGLISRIDEYVDPTVGAQLA